MPRRREPLWDGAASENVLSSAGLGSAFTNGPLTALANGGVYQYGGGFPNNTFNGNNYWVDVVLAD
jgi:hypothetical protein